MAETGSIVGNIYTVDWDSVGQTIGVTVTGSATRLIIIVTVSGTVSSLDCIHGQAGNILNRGRIILVGPGSVIGRTTAVRTLDWATPNTSVEVRGTP